MFFLQEMLLFVLNFLQLPGLFKFPFFLAYEGCQHVTLARCEIEVRHRSVGVLVPEINEIEDQLGIQQKRHICAFGSSGPLLSVSDDFSEFFIINLIIIRGHLEGDLLLVRTWSRTSSSSGLSLQQSGAS